MQRMILAEAGAPAVPGRRHRGQPLVRRLLQAFLSDRLPPPAPRPAAPPPASSPPPDPGGDPHLLRELVEHAPEAILGVDGTGTITVFNHAAERLFGYPGGELLGRPASRLVPDWDTRAARTPADAAAEPPDEPAPATARIEATCRRRDGTEFPAELAISRRPAGGVERLAVVVRDQSASRRAVEALREREERFHQAFTAASVGMAIIDVCGRWLEVNDALCRLLGYTADELRALDFSQVTHVDDLEEDIRLGMRLVRGEIQSFSREKRYLHRSGTPLWVLVSASIARDPSGRPRYFLVQVQDVSEHRSAEEELRRRSEELARSNTELEQFAYVASHDLQEPLRMVASYTELLSQRYRGQLDERAEKWLGYAADGARRLQALIADLLALSHVGSTGRPFAPAALGDVLDRALVPLAPALDESGGEVVRGELPEVMGDAAQLELLARNLVSNAIKFRRPDVPPRVEVRAEPDPEVAGWWLVSVSDNGIGLDMKFAERIFVIFQRLHTRDEYPGTGIGLAICRKIVERHGGRIWVDSTPGQGTTVRFTLPGTAV